MMKKTYLILLALSVLFCWSCTEPQATDNTSETTTEQTSIDAHSDNVSLDQPVQEEVKLAILQDISITPAGEPDERGHYWGVPVTITMAEGYSLEVKSADKGRKDWLFNQFELQKGGNTIYTFPHKEEDMRSVTICNEKAEQWYPKVVTKGAQTAIVLARYMGEDVEDSHVVDAIKIEDGAFVAYVEKVAEYGYGGDFSKAEVEGVFTKLFE